jgi:hypothetical protein
MGNLATQIPEAGKRHHQQSDNSTDQRKLDQPASNPSRTQLIRHPGLGTTHVTMDVGLIHPNRDMIAHPRHCDADPR